MGNWQLLLVGRFVAGVVLGLNSALVIINFIVKVPVYVSEFSPPDL